MTATKGVIESEKSASTTRNERSANPDPEIKQRSESSDPAIKQRNVSAADNGDKKRKESVESMEMVPEKVDHGFCATMKRYPKGVFFCFGNEFAERFSFYGMTAILTLYLVNAHNMDGSEAALIFHAFHFVAYFSPIFGSIAADGFLGRYRVIVYVSVLYCVGHLLITVGTVESIELSARLALDMTGLFIIGISTGGIKPCVVSFAADQFPPTMLKEREQFFSLFYFSINLGSLLSMILIPIIRTYSYSMAFLIPAIFMGLALVIFLCGRPFYKIVECTENIIWSVVKCVCSGLGKTIKNRGAPVKGGHWLDHSVPVYGQQLVDDIKTMFNIMLLYVPVIIFWALFDQQGSTWVLQANRMDGRLGHLTIVPEQMNFLNPLFIITLIPLFVKFVYPCLTKRNILVRPLQRMTCGGILAALSFVIAGFLQLKINSTLVPIPAKGQTKYTFVNLAQCQIKFDDFRLNIDGQMTIDMTAPSGNLPKFQYDSKCEIENDPANFSVNHKLKKDHGELVTFWNSPTVPYSQVSYHLEKTKDSNAKIYPMFDPSFDLYYNASLLVRHKERRGYELRYVKNETEDGFLIVKPESVWDSHNFEISVEVCDNDTGECNEKFLTEYEKQPGEAYALVISSDNGSFVFYNLIPPNTVHILWQTPQYFVITIGEMFFSISGLEFSYSQAAPSMKSVLAAIWLLTVAFGNLVDMIISGSGKIDNKAVEFFVYASLMFLVMLLFIFLARRYKYVDKDHENDEYTAVKKDSKNSKTSL